MARCMRRKKKAGQQARLGTSFRMTPERLERLRSIAKERRLKMVNLIDEMIDLYDLIGPKNVPPLLDLLHESGLQKDKFRLYLEDKRREFAAKKEHTATIP
jgi:hypothetical protein